MLVAYVILWCFRLASYLLAFTQTSVLCLLPATLAMQEYLQLAKKYYNAEPQAVDFVGAANEIRREINSRVEEQTEGKLQPLLSQS